MATSFVDEYLVKLGASVDQSGMAKFAQALREARAVADNSATAIAGSFFKAQTEIVGGFMAIGTAAVGLVDKVAMADQQYRLMALSMHISKDSARALSISMEALGATMDQLAWDPELQRRNLQLMKDMGAMSPGGDFDAQMEKIRDIRFQFTRMEVELQFLGMHVVNDFLTALGAGPDTLLSKLTRFNDWVTHNLPEISKKVVTLFLPVWHDVEEVGLATGKAFEATGLAFTNLIGIFDHSLGGATFDFQKFAGAVTDIVGTFATWATSIAKVEESLMHLVSAMGLLGQFKLSAAGKELGAAGGDVDSGSVGAAVIPGVVAAVGGWKVYKAIKKAGLLKFVLRRLGLSGAAAAEGGGEVAAAAGAETVAGEVAAASVAAAPETGGISLLGLLGSGALALGGSYIGANVLHKLFGKSSVGASNGASGGNADVAGLIDRQAAALGIDPAAAHALARAENVSESQRDKYGNLIYGVGSDNVKTSAVGVYQITRKTAQALGIDPTDTEQNINGGLTLFSQLLRHYGGNEAEAVGAYHEGQSKMDSVLAGQTTLSSDAQAEIARYARYRGAAGDVHVGSVVVHVHGPGHTNEQVGRVVANTIRDTAHKRIQRNLYEAQDAGTAA